jgi:hypothetical protein
MADRIAVTRNTALRMFWDEGFDNERLLTFANAALDTLKQATEGYYYADEVVPLIDQQTALHLPHLF